MSYKLYKVTFDTDPGGWKSGGDPFKLVLATSPEQAIKITEKPTWFDELISVDKEDGYDWIEKWSYDEEGTMSDYTRYKKGDISISVKEIQFEGFEMRIDTIRGHKINDILGDE